jgi:PAS domain S-box-containing protein
MHSRAIDVPLGHVVAGMQLGNESMKTVTNTRIIILIGCLAVFLVLLTASSYQRLRQIEKARASARETNNLVHKFEQLYSVIVDAETGQRGFLIAGEDAYLQPFIDSTNEMASRKDEIENVVKNHPEYSDEFKKLFDLIDSKMTEMKRTIDVARQDGLEAGRNIVNTQEGLRLMQAIRGQTRTLSSTLDKVYTSRVQALNNSFQRARVEMVIAAVLGLTACALVLPLVVRELRGRQRATELIRQEQENLRVTLESIGDGVIATNDRGEVTMLNPVAQQLTGWTLEEALGQQSTVVFNIVNEETGAVVESPVTRVLREGVIVGLANHTVLIAKDGSRRPISDSGAPIRRADKIVGAIMVFRDMSEQRDAEKDYEQYVAQIQSERLRLRSVIEAMPVGVILADADGKLTHLNSELKKIWGDSTPLSSTFEHYQDWKGWWPRTGELIKGEEWAMSRALKNGEIVRPEEVLIETFDGQKKTILNSASPLFDIEGNLVGGVVAEVDITEQAQIRASLADAQSRLESMLEIGEIGTWDWNIQSNRVYADRNLARMFRVADDQAQGGSLESYVDAVHPDDRELLNQVISEAVKAGDVFSAEYRLTDDDGEVRWITARARIERDEQGRPVNMPGVVIDVTERRLLEDNLRKLASDLSIADQRKNDFIATLAHELRNPLAPIRTGIETLKWQSRDAGANQVIETMERQVRQMVRLIEDLLDISRITRGSLSLRQQPSELSEILNNAIESTRPHFEDRSQEFFVELPKEEICVNADAARLTQVVANLLDNAAKYTPHGGKIWLKAFEEDGRLVISVKDTGFGISHEMQEHIFQMFGQVKRSLEEGYSGLGIGLTLVKTIVEMHDGTIDVLSEGVNKGSEFRVTMPTCELPEVPVIKPPQFDEIQESTRQLRVLVVDDNRAAAKMLKVIIEKLGHQVELAHDGVDGIEKAQQLSPHLILMDIGMPKMNGYEATRRIHATDWGKDIVIAALSGWGHEDDKRRTQEAGFDYHLVKPAEITALNEILLKVATENPDAAVIQRKEAMPLTTPNENAQTAMDDPLPKSDVPPESVRKLAHDIKTPLSIITMGIELLKQNPNIGEDQKMVCEMIDGDGVKPLETLISDMIEILKKLSEK